MGYGRRNVGDSRGRLSGPRLGGHVLLRDHEIGGQPCCLNGRGSNGDGWVPTAPPRNRKAPPSLYCLADTWQPTFMSSAAREKIKIRLEDGRILPAEIVGRDSMTDIALVKAPMDLPVPVFAPVPALGANVCAIGNQFGLGLSVTCGVISARNRTGTGFNPIEDFIQTDAVINPGGSGGALVDEKSRLVGLMSAIFTKDSDANIGVNFASSMKLVMRVVRDLKDNGRVIRGKTGFDVRDLTAAERATLAGAVINRLARSGAALKAGLRVGDVIVTVGNRPIKRASDVPSAIHMHRPGESIDITVRRGQVQRRLSLTLAP